MTSPAAIYVSTQTGLFRATMGARVEDIEPIELGPVGRVWPIVTDIRNPDRLYAATMRGGVYRSDDRGQTWHEKNAGLLYKETYCIVQHPVSGELFVGTGPASVFKSTDCGDNWTFCEQLHTLPETKAWTFPNPPHIAHVKGLGLCRNDPKLVFGAIEEGYIIRSRDGGETWTTLSAGSEYDSHAVNVMPDDPHVIVSTSGTGVYRSEDGGEHFVEANDGLTRRYMATVVIHDREPEVLFTAAAETPPLLWRKRAQGANSQFYRSDDQGRTWKALSGGLPALMTAAARSTTGYPDRPGSFLAGMDDGSIWMTGDHGESFAQIATGFPAIYGIAISSN